MYLLLNRLVYCVLLVFFVNILNNKHWPNVHQQNTINQSIQRQTQCTQKLSPQNAPDKINTSFIHIVPFVGFEYILPVLSNKLCLHVVELWLLLLFMLKFYSTTTNWTNRYKSCNIFNNKTQDQVNILYLFCWVYWICCCWRSVNWNYQVYKQTK